MNLLKFVFAVVIFTALGCGTSPMAQKDRISPFLNELDGSPTVTLIVSHEGKEHRRQLSQVGRQTLRSLIESARPDNRPADYIILGSLEYHSADGGKGDALLMYISEAESGLRIDARTYIRGINAMALRQLVTSPDVASPE